MRLFTSIMLSISFSIPSPFLAMAQPQTATGDNDTVATKEFISKFEVLVTAPRQSLPLRENPAATTVVAGEALEQLPKGIGIDEPMKLVPGVRVDNQANGERVHMSIRGQGILTERGIRGIKILLDGLPLNDASGFAPDFYDVDWTAVEQMEVLRGPAAALYGGGSSSGVVNIMTGWGGPDPIQGEFTTTIGSYNFWKSHLAAGGTQKDLQYNLSVARTTGDGYRDHTKFHGTVVNAKVQWDVTPAIRITPMVTWTEYFNENAEGLNADQVIENPRQANPDAAAFNEFQDTQRFTAGLLGRYSITTDQTIDLTAYFRRTIYSEPVPSSVQHRNAGSPGFSLQYQLNSSEGWPRNHATVGTDLQWQTIDEYRKPNLGGAVEGPETLSDETITQQGAGLFAIDRLELSAEWSILGSVRYDDIRNKLDDHLKSDTLDLSGEASFRRTTARIGVAWSLRPGLSLYANWGQGFLPPSTEELANNPDALGGFNSHLYPATSSGEEVGVRAAISDQFMLDVATFYLVTDGDFGRYRIESRPLETFYGNIGSSHRFGVELLAAWKPASWVTLQSAYTFSTFTYTNPAEIDGKRLPNSPDHIVYVDLEVRPVDPLTLHVGTEVQSRWYVDPTNATSVGGFTLLDARAEYRWKIWDLRGELSVSGRNLLSREYIAFSEPDPDGNSYHPGSAREVFVGVVVKL